MSNKNYKLEIELSSKKARCAIAIKNEVNYVRRTDLEEIDTSLIIIDVNSVINYRLINVYRSFNPPNGKTQKQAFAQQLNLIKTAYNNNLAREIIVLGDFNLDEKSTMLLTMYAETFLKIPQNEVPNAFADYFESKITKITNETKIDPNVYNGKRKLFCSDQNFMSENEILIAVKSLSVKNSEGHDRIP